MTSFPMAKTTYTRSKGEKYTYEIEYDEHGFKIRRNGQLLAHGGAGLAGRRVDLPGVAQTAQLQHAQAAIEDLVGMLHE